LGAYSSSDARPVGLRPVTPEDEAFLYAVYAGTRREEVAAWGWDAAQQEAFLKMQFTAQQRSYQLQYPEAEHQVITLGGRPVGRIMVLRTAAEVLLIDIALLPESRRAGVGTALIEDLLEEAARSGKPVRLQVLKSNPARRLYQRLGFTTTGESGIHFQMEWRQGAGSESEA
jgi:ribosomal protein S18 acetylase RimI-like enzyme